MRKLISLFAALLMTPLLSFGQVVPAGSGQRVYVSNFLPRQDITYSAVAAAAGATTVETAITLTKSVGTTATTTGTSFVITAGKRFHITSITFSSRGNAAVATAQSTVFSFRINTAGAVTTSSTPVKIIVESATDAVVAGRYDRFQLPIPDGLEILGDGTMQFGVTANAVYVTNAPTWDVNITGFEY